MHMASSFLCETADLEASGATSNSNSITNVNSACLSSTSATSPTFSLASFGCLNSPDSASVLNSSMTSSSNISAGRVNSSSSTSQVAPVLDAPLAAAAASADIDAGSDASNSNSSMKLSRSSAAHLLSRRCWFHWEDLDDFRFQLGSIGGFKLCIKSTEKVWVDRATGQCLPSFIPTQDQLNETVLVSALPQKFISFDPNVHKYKKPAAATVLGHINQNHTHSLPSVNAHFHGQTVSNASSTDPFHDSSLSASSGTSNSTSTFRSVAVHLTGGGDIDHEENASANQSAVSVVPRYDKVERYPRFYCHLGQSYKDTMATRASASIVDGGSLNVNQSSTARPTSAPSPCASSNSPISIATSGIKAPRNNTNPKTGCSMFIKCKLISFAHSVAENSSSIHGRTSRSTTRKKVYSSSITEQESLSNFFQMHGAVHHYAWVITDFNLSHNHSIHEDALLDWLSGSPRPNFSTTASPSRAVSPSNFLAATIQSSDSFRGEYLAYLIHLVELKSLTSREMLHAFQRYFPQTDVNEQVFTNKVKQVRRERGLSSYDDISVIRKKCMAQLRRAAAAGQAIPAYEEYIDPDTNKLQRIFWMNNQMIHAFKRYGQFLVMDGTSNTNRFGMILFLVVVMDGYKRCQIVCACFMESLVTDAYVWVFKNIRAAVGSRAWSEVLCVATDGEEAMIEAVKLIFPSHVDRIRCIYHIQSNLKQKALPKLPSHQKTTFMDDFWRCVNSSSFEARWSSFLQKYSNASSYLFDNIGKSKRHWANQYTRHYTSFNARSTQASEVTNAALKGNESSVNNHAFLYETYDAVERLVRRQCEARKANQDADCRIRLQYGQSEAGTRSNNSHMSFSKKVCELLTKEASNQVIMQYDRTDSCETECVSFRVNIQSSAIQRLFDLQENKSLHYVQVLFSSSHHMHDQQAMDITSSDSNMNLTPSSSSAAAAVAVQSNEMGWQRPEELLYPWPSDDNDHEPSADGIRRKFKLYHCFVSHSFMFCSCGYPDRMLLPCCHVLVANKGQLGSAWMPSQIHPRWFSKVNITDLDPENESAVKLAAEMEDMDLDYVNANTDDLDHELELSPADTRVSRSPAAATADINLLMLRRRYVRCKMLPEQLQVNSNLRPGAQSPHNCELGDVEDSCQVPLAPYRMNAYATDRPTESSSSPAAANDLGMHNMLSISSSTTEVQNIESSVENYFSRQEKIKERRKSSSRSASATGASIVPPTLVATKKAIKSLFKPSLSSASGDKTVLLAQNKAYQEVQKAFTRLMELNTSFPDKGKTLLSILTCAKNAITEIEARIPCEVLHPAAAQSSQSKLRARGRRRVLTDHDHETTSTAAVATPASTSISRSRSRHTVASTIASTSVHTTTSSSSSSTTRSAIHTNSMVNSASSNVHINDVTISSDSDPEAKGSNSNSNILSASAAVTDSSSGVLFHSPPAKRGKPSSKASRSGGQKNKFHTQHVSLSQENGQMISVLSAAIKEALGPLIQAANSNAKQQAHASQSTVPPVRSRSRAASSSSSSSTSASSNDNSRSTSPSGTSSSESSSSNSSSNSASSSSRSSSPSQRARLKKQNKKGAAAAGSKRKRKAAGDRGRTSTRRKSK